MGPGPAPFAVGIRGRARALKEGLDCWPGDAAIVIEVSKVKNDALQMAPVASGITYSVPPDVGIRIQQYLDEWREFRLPIEPHVCSDRA